jgi:phosphomannomutase
MGKDPSRSYSMPVIYHPGTGFDVGDPNLLPLDANSLPSRDEIQLAAHSLILSASGWRMVFADPKADDPQASWAVSKDSEDSLSPRISKSSVVIAAHMAKAFGNRIKAGAKEACVILGIDTRPTGPAIADVFVRVLLGMGIEVRYCFIISAPEIMAYAGSSSELPALDPRYAEGFAYITASHNPPGHNGIKFGIGSGGVLSAQEIAPIIKDLQASLRSENPSRQALEMLEQANPSQIAACYRECSAWKRFALSSYTLFTHRIISDSENLAFQAKYLDSLEKSCRERPLGIVAELNGSARTVSIDRDFFEALGLRSRLFNDKPRQFARRFVPEGESLALCAGFLQELHDQDTAYQIGYAPDCDGDRGNLVIWDSDKDSTRSLEAQEVFSLSCLAELTCLIREGRTENLAIVVNDATSMRIEAIARLLGARVFRAETGEANVVALAEKLTAEGWNVRILGEGSNGGTIVHPSRVRDPLSTLGAMIRLLRLPDEIDAPNPFRIWLKAIGREEEFVEEYDLSDIIATLPRWISTSVFETRAALRVQSADKAALKAKYATIFEAEWLRMLPELKRRYGIVSWRAFATNGIVEKEIGNDFGASGTGGLRIVFYTEEVKPLAFIWMRGSGTEPVFRVMADIAGGDVRDEEFFLSWHASMVRSADS